MSSRCPALLPASLRSRKCLSLKDLPQTVHCCELCTTRLQSSARKLEGECVAIAIGEQVRPVPAQTYQRAYKKQWMSLTCPVQQRTSPSWLPGVDAEQKQRVGAGFRTATWHRGSRKAALLCRYHAATAAARPPPAGTVVVHATPAPPAAPPLGLGATERKCSGRSVGCWYCSKRAHTNILGPRTWPAGRPLANAEHPAAWRSSSQAGDGNQCCRR